VVAVVVVQGLELQELVELVVAEMEPLPQLAEQELRTLAAAVAVLEIQAQQVATVVRALSSLGTQTRTLGLQTSAAVCRLHRRRGLDFEFIHLQLALGQ
jgi:hypothetical protein